MKTLEQNKENLKQWLTIEFLLIQPIEKIIKGLKAKEYGDGDIDYLEYALNTYMEITANAMSETGIVSHEPFTVLNEYTRAKYIEYFSTLLIFFNDVKNSIKIES
jgi:hypothetical protein